MLSEGKQVDGGLLEQYCAQTGQAVASLPPADEQPAFFGFKNDQPEASIDSDLRGDTVSETMLARLDGHDANSRGFLKLQRSVTAEELLKDPSAFVLLTLIAMRARWSEEPSIAGLSYGQAHIGDWKTIGLTEKQYRCAKQRLARAGLARFDSTRRGTVATLTDSRVFSLRDERDASASVLEQGGRRGGQKGGRNSEEKSQIGADDRTGVTADKGRTKGGRGATNVERKKGQKEQKEGVCLPDVPPSLNSPRFTTAWRRWTEIRMRGRKPQRPWGEFFAEQLNWLTSLDSAESAVEAVEKSIRNGWTGLFPPSPTYNNRSRTARSVDPRFLNVLENGGNLGS